MSEGEQRQQFCRQCGMRVQAGIAFCTSCGARLGSSTPDSRGRTGNPIPPLIQKYESHGSQDNSHSRRLGEWYGNLTRASKRGLVAISVLAVVIAISLFASISVDEGSVDTYVSNTNNSDSGDWDSEESYLADIDDSLGKVDIIRDDSADSIDSYESGYVYGTEASEMLQTDRENLQTHIDYFEDSVPPDGYEDYQSTLLESWYYLSDAILSIESAYYNEDMESFNELEEAKQLLTTYFDLTDEAEEIRTESSTV